MKTIYKVRGGCVLCLECYYTCPVRAITIIENVSARIDPDKCINCGACVAGCPFGAISVDSKMTGVIDALQDDTREVVALLAPSIEGQFGAATLPQMILP